MRYAEIRRRAPKKRDTWARKVFCDPIAVPLVYLMAKHTKVRPIGLTYAGFVMGVMASILFALDLWWQGAVAYYAHFLFDGMDGKLTRAKEEDDTLRGMVDIALDGIVWTACIMGLAVSSLAPIEVTIGLLAWACLHFLEMRFSSILYRLRAEKGIRGHWLIGERDYHNWLLGLYTEISHAFDKIGLNVIPSVGESSFLIFIVSPLLGKEWVLWVILVGIILMLPSVLGNLVLAYATTKEGQ